MPTNQSNDFKQIDIQGNPVHYLEYGTGSKTMLMVHGYPGRPQDFRWLNEPLQDHFRIIQIAMPGMGHTPVATWPAPGLTDRSEFLAAFLDALKIEKCWILGHSINGVLCVAFAARYPSRIEALILLSSIGQRPHRAYRKLPPHFLFQMSQLPGFRFFMQPVLRKMFLSMGFPKKLSEESILHSMRCAYALSFDAIKEHIESVQCPTMSIWTKNDPLIEAEISKETAQNLPKGPRIIFEKGGHNPQKDKAKEIANEILSWSAQL